MKKTILFVAMILSLSAQSQTFSSPTIIKSFDEEIKDGIWYSSDKTEESNIKMIIDIPENLEGYYQDLIYVLGFDIKTPYSVDGKVRIWKNENYIIRVSISTYTIIHVLKIDKN